MAREKRREQLHVTVPNVFRCPISMDVMKSPVSLCTGVTYDRTSIEKWLSLGHNTCPATMQQLPSTTTVPNLTLRRLINIWISQSSDAVSKQQAVDLINGESLDSDSLVKLIGFLRASDENLRLIAQSEDFVAKFVDSFVKSDEIRFCELVVDVFDLISNEIGVNEMLSRLILRSDGEIDRLSAFVFVLERGNLESRIKSAKILELIALNSESQRKIAEKTKLLHELYSLCTVETDVTAVSAGLSALAAVTTSRPVKKDLIRFGAVRNITNILSSSDYSPTVRAVIENSLNILELLSMCTEGRVAISEDRDCVLEIVKRLMKCSAAATEHGVTVLWSVCCLARDCTAKERVAGVNGLTKVLLVMQSDCSSNAKMMCGELVKVLRGAKSARSNLAPYETRTTHITPY